MIRTLVLTLILAIATVGMVTAPVAQPVQAAEMKTVTLDVQNMTCKFCPITVRKALEKVPGVTEATASFKTKTATVSFDPTKTNVQALIKATANAGYPSKVLTN